MHRHGYKGRKLGRQTDQRRALIKGLASNMVLNEAIVTTRPKAKELIPYLEKLITKSKKGGLHNRRQVISKMANVESANKLFDEIAPKLSARNSGYFRIKPADSRKGDNAVMANVSFVDDLKADKSEVKSPPKVARVTKKPAIVASKKPTQTKVAAKKLKTKESK